MSATRVRRSAPPARLQPEFDRGWIGVEPESWLGLRSSRILDAAAPSRPKRPPGHGGLSAYVAAVVAALMRVR